LLVASAGSDDEVRFWVAKTGQGVGSFVPAHTRKATHIVLSNDGHTLVTAGEDGAVRLWDVSIQNWLSLARLRANRNLTQDEWRQFLGESERRKTCLDRPF
jgi:WD40 repeat protein